jgi:hypothetical protein
VSARPARRSRASRRSGPERRGAADRPPLARLWVPFRSGSRAAQPHAHQPQECSDAGQQHDLEAGERQRRVEAAGVGLDLLVAAALVGTEDRPGLRVSRLSAAVASSRVAMPASLGPSGRGVPGGVLLAADGQRLVVACRRLRLRRGASARGRLAVAAAGVAATLPTGLTRGRPPAVATTASGLAFARGRVAPALGRRGRRCLGGLLVALGLRLRRRRGVVRLRSGTVRLSLRRGIVRLSLRRGAVALRLLGRARIGLRGGERHTPHSHEGDG